MFVNGASYYDRKRFTTITIYDGIDRRRRGMAVRAKHAVAHRSGGGGLEGRGGIFRARTFKFRHTRDGRRSCDAFATTRRLRRSFSRLVRRAVSSFVRVSRGRPYAFRGRAPSYESPGAARTGRYVFGTTRDVVETAVRGFFFYGRGSSKSTTDHSRNEEEKKRAKFETNFMGTKQKKKIINYSCMNME